MGENEKQNSTGNSKPSSTNYLGGGIGSGTSPVSGLSGMSPEQRVSYIKGLQQASPIKKIAAAVKDIDWGKFGLSNESFRVASSWVNKMKNFYDKQVGADNKHQSKNFNQKIAGLTENVRGVERIKHEVNSSLNVDLPNIEQLQSQQNSGSCYIETDWAPKEKGKVE